MEQDNRLALGGVGLALVCFGVGFGWLTLQYGARVDMLRDPHAWDVAALAIMAVACAIAGGCAVISAAFINPRQRRLRRRARRMAREWHR
jgi:hypothetical protein